jgi:hypothetical protein
MYGLVEHEVSRQRRADIQREVVAYRLEKKLRAGHGEESRFLEDLGWKLARYAGLLGKRLRGPDGADCYQAAAKNGGGPVS